MLVRHVTDWATGDARAVLPGWPSFTLTDVAPVAFFVAAGASMALFVAARRLGLLGDIGAGLAVADCVVAPRVPLMPWSPRTGRRPRAGEVSAAARTARPAPAPPAPARP